MCNKIYKNGDKCYNTPLYGVKFCYVHLKNKKKYYNNILDEILNINNIEEVYDNLKINILSLYFKKLNLSQDVIFILKQIKYFFNIDEICIQNTIQSYFDETIREKDKYDLIKSLFDDKLPFILKSFQQNPIEKIKILDFLELFLRFSLKTFIRLSTENRTEFMIEMLKSLIQINQKRIISREICIHLYHQNKTNTLKCNQLIKLGFNKDITQFIIHSYL